MLFPYDIMQRNSSSWRRRAISAVAGLLAASSAFAADTNPAPVNATDFLYIGTYTGKRSRGIYYCPFDARTGTLGAPKLAVETRSPSFLALHPNGQWIYSSGEMGSGAQRAGAVSAFRIERPSGTLTLLNQESSGGAGPCHVSVDEKGKCLLTANYGSGSIASLPIAKDGKLEPPASKIQHQGSSVNKQRQAGPHAHCLTPDPKNRFALACDLGLDHVMVYKLDAGKATLTPNDPAYGVVPPGSGPRHMAFHPKGKFLYVVNEMGSSITAFDWDGKSGGMKELQTISTLPAGFTNSTTCAEIAVHPSGKFVYASNRGHDSIAVFSVDEATGKLSAVEHASTQGRTPRHFTIDPSGRWLLAANQESDSIVVFAVDPKSGRLRDTGQKVEAMSPVCLMLVPIKVSE